MRSKACGLPRASPTRARCGHKKHNIFSMGPKLRYPTVPVMDVVLFACGFLALPCRYAEQKMRLSRCGLGRVMYIVEGTGLPRHAVLTSAHLDTAIHTTQVSHGFHVKKTANIDDTVRFLVCMHETLAASLHLLNRATATAAACINPKCCVIGR